MARKYEEEDRLIDVDFAHRTLRDRRADFNVQRRIDDGKLKKVHRMLETNDPGLRDTPIKFDRTGRLMDGRHRLQGVVDTGISFWGKVRRYKDD